MTDQRAFGPFRRWFSIVGVLFLLLSLTPLGVSAQIDTLLAQQQALAQQTEGYIEVHVLGCDPGTTGSIQQLKDACHGKGLVGVNVSVVGLDAGSTVNMPNKVTVQPSNPGPAMINTGTIPVGNYRIQVDQPTDTNTFAIHCELATSDTEVGFTPDAAPNAFSVALGAQDDVVCDVYVIPIAPAQTQQPPQSVAAVNPSVDITFHTCNRADFPSDDRSWTAMETYCDAVAENPTSITLTARDASGATTPQPLDANAKTTFELQPGTWDLYSSLDPNVWGEYLFCEYTGQPQYQKTFDQTSGATTFEDLVDEQISCDWFGVDSTAPVSTATTVPSPTTAPSPTATATETATATQTEPAAAQRTVTLTMNLCGDGYAPADASSLTAFQTDCAQPNPGISFTATNGTDPQQYAVTDATGVATFAAAPAGELTIWSDVPLAAATEYYFCSVNGGDIAPVTLNQGVAAFGADAASIDCAIFVSPTSSRQDQNGASVTVHLATCPTGYTGDAWYNDCHANGVADQEFTLTGPNGDQTATTVVPTTPGPGIADFSALPGGSYTLAGGPPQDFGTVYLYCSDPSTNERVPAEFVNGIGTFTLADNQSVICDWYFTPENASGVTPTPTATQAPRKAEIFVTMFVCDTSLNIAGSSFSDLDSTCTKTLNDVQMNLQVPGGVPISASTGESGDGAVRFYELNNGDYVLTPTLPANYVSAAVYCDLDGVNVYQKALANGSTTYTDLTGEKVSCSWFVTQKPTQPATTTTNPTQPRTQTQQGPTGSITVREMLCAGDRASIKDWERECQPGTSGTSFTLKSSDGKISQSGTPNAQGVYVFSGLPNGYYEMEQTQGVWCRAAAEHVDGQSRVVVQAGGNTDVFFYQCNQQPNLPNTGSGSALVTPDIADGSLLGLAAAALPLFGLALWQRQRYADDAWQVAPAKIIATQGRTRLRRNGFRIH